ncbi:MAG TPA: cell division protein ZapA [Caulobacteraceae bacterium]|jgi:cell division protein ZapA|nr:cell division protein ZapA [Caulobacteraceae bacterium]
MATVNVEINGRHYMVGCADGQEERVRLLSRQFDANVKQVAGDVGAVGELRLFLMAALLVSDELAEVRAQFNRLRVDFEEAQMKADAAGGASPGAAPAPEVDSAALEALNAAAERVERLLLQA